MPAEGPDLPELAITLSGRDQIVTIDFRPGFWQKFRLCGESWPEVTTFQVAGWRQNRHIPPRLAGRRMTRRPSGAAWLVALGDESRLTALSVASSCHAVTASR